MLSETLATAERSSSCSNGDASDLFFFFSCFVCTCDPRDFDHIRQESEVVINDDQEHEPHLLTAVERLICAQSQPARWRADTADLIHWCFLRVGWR